MNHTHTEKKFIRRKSTTIRRKFCSKLRKPPSPADTTNPSVWVRAALIWLGHWPQQVSPGWTAFPPYALPCHCSCWRTCKQPLLTKTKATATSQATGQLPRNLLSQVLKFLLKLPIQRVPLKFPMLQCLLADLIMFIELLSYSTRSNHSKVFKPTALLAWSAETGMKSRHLHSLLPSFSTKHALRGYKESFSSFLFDVSDLVLTIRFILSRH